MNRPSKTLTVALLLGGGLVFGSLAALAGINRRDEVAGLRQEIQYDDFAFSVQGVRKSRTVGSVAAKGVFYIVTLKVANRARRVSFKFKPTSPMLISEDGKQFRVSSESQRALATDIAAGDACAAPIPPGSFCVKEVVFDVPDDVSVPWLKISRGGLAGDILDTIFYGRKVISLDTNEQESLAR
jgi:hypothetical protein